MPVVALGLGSVAGPGEGRLAASHDSVMTKSSAMFVAGPPVVARLGQELTKQELGGWETQYRAGAVDHAAGTEDDAFARARRISPICRTRCFPSPSGCRATIRPTVARKSSASALLMVGRVAPPLRI